MNNELIKIEGGRVSARELHEKLNIKARFNDWFPRMLSYGFQEGQDFDLLKNEYLENTGFDGLGTQKKDYSITLDMAKHIAMIQRTPEGMKYRQYFIDMEKYIIATQQEKLFEEWIKSNSEEKEILERRLAKCLKTIYNICGEFEEISTIYFNKGMLIPIKYIQDTIDEKWTDKNGEIKKSASNKIQRSPSMKWFISECGLKCIKRNWILNQEELEKKYKSNEIVF